jgi:hypothetical protein
MHLLGSISAPAQKQTTGGIMGKVTDTHDAAIVGASITGENVATGERRSTTTDQSGAFAIAVLPPAEYRLSVAAQRFATAMYNHVTVAGTATATLNVKLEVAPANVHAEVNDAPPVVRLRVPSSRPCSMFVPSPAYQCRRATSCNLLRSRRA